jgi:hypothetical protein
MVYRGTYKNGVVVLDDTANLSDGQRVVVETETPALANPSPQNSLPQSGDAPTVWQKLLELSGTVASGNSDASRNHDYYIYGAPKRDPEL